MNVYKINGYSIAAKSKNEAYYLFLEEMNNLEDVFDNGLELHQGDEDDFTVTVRRLTESEIKYKDIKCCEDGCDECGENDYTYYSLEDIMNMQNNFPCVLAKEE